ncbi:hypothetical protein ALC57_06539, partial [Trachymyrmex cornetzi]
ILASLEEFQERDSGWALSRILNLAANANKLNPLRVGCHINYTIEKGIVPIRLADRKRSKHVNLLYVEDDSAGHFALIKNLSRLVSSQINKKGHRKYFCDRVGGHVRCQKIAVLKTLNTYIFRFLIRCVFLEIFDRFHTFRTPCRFLASSLDKLASFLNNDKLRVLRREFSNLSEENFNLLTRKGVFPYEYIDCNEKLNELRLPPRESFYSSLTDSTVSESDYAHAVNVWQRFSIQTLGEYSYLYLKTDILLADIFENFRDSCIVSYGHDPAYYYTLSGFTWDAMLKHTGVKFELLISTWSCL